MTTIQSATFINLDPASLLAAMEDALGSVTCAARPSASQQSALRTADAVETGRTNVDAIMARAPVDISTMSVEDILFWLMICIQDAYNTHIQKKAEDVQGAQTALDGATGASEQDRQQLQSSLDQETQALQRLLTKRDQFVTMFQQMLKKYDESVAKVWQ
jgi:hypothetical protein